MRPIDGRSYQTCSLNSPPRLARRPETATAFSTVGFANLAGGNYRLSAASPFRNGATDGTDVGCNIDTLNAAARIKY